MHLRREFLWRESVGESCPSGLSGVPSKVLIRLGSEQLSPCLKVLMAWRSGCREARLKMLNE
ncbi:hypothetical protein E2C01_039799 [Portunus trituberculatus]|uniref:Uncharacterized protein n=1 Tax=Portunus trituberculatus TaxID=210409 RepID=A0A5B7FLN7_PORTR|nr:hypothetical protein [Portunus trituberculatus]